MRFSTPIDIKRPPFRIDEDSSVMMLGSCFAENIGKYFVSNKFHANINPFGVLYNPISIFECLNLLIAGEFPYEQALFESGGMWNSWYHSSKFSAVSYNQCVDNINATFLVSSKSIPDIDVLFVTLGTNHCYLHKAKRITVSNCHKCPADSFEEDVLDVQQIVDCGAKCLDKLLGMNPDVRVVFTVSPYRYQKYGFHENQLSKAALLLSVDALQNKYPANVTYFPAYELVHDELRDYRYYAEDMLHVSSFTEQYIWEKVVGTFFSEHAVSMLKTWNGIQNKINHRPLAPENIQYKVFLEKLFLEIENFKSRYPSVNVNDELKEIHDKITQFNTK